MSDYNSSNIVALDDISHVQTRRGMYIGDAIDPSPLLSEIIDNAVDESLTDSKVKMQLYVNTKDNVYIIRDYARGIPHGKIKVPNTDIEKEVLEVLMTITNSGGKFDHRAYKNSGGLHGCGITVTNALSNYMKIISYRDNESVHAYCENGKLTLLEYRDQDQETGTYVEFKPNPEYFDSEVVPESYIINRCKILKAFGYDIEYYKDDVLQEFNIESIYDLLPKSEVSYCKDTIRFTSSTDEDILVAFDYTSDTHYNSIGYTNMIYNRNGGTHTNYIYNAVCDAWSEFNKEVSTELKYDDCTLGLNILVAVFIGDIAFSSQTKEKLAIPKKNLDELMDGFKNKFIQYLKDNPELRKGLLKRFEEYRISQNKLLSQKEIMNLIVKNKPTSDGTVRRRSVVPGLYECTSTNKEGTELFIVEGQSACGPLARARDRRFQAVLPLRGKIKNVTYMDLKDIVKFDTVRNIINAIGAGCGSDVESHLSRYEKIIILVDADPDGAHICALILSLLVNATPNLIRDGLVYVVKAPLYGYNYDGKRYYCNNLNELPEGYTDFTRYKGLGELDDSELRDTCLIPGQREIYRVQYPNNIDKFNEVLGTSSGRAQLLKDLHILVNINSSEEVNYEVQD